MDFFLNQSRKPHDIVLFTRNMPSLKLKSSLPDEEGAASKGKAQEDSEA